MARRCKKPMPKPKNLRLPSDFIESVLLGTIMNNGSRALACSVEPPPSLMTEHEVWDGKKLDALFGMSHRRRIASQMWHGYELAKAEAGVNTPEADELGEADAYVGGPPLRVWNLRIPADRDNAAMVIQTTARSFYPTGGTGAQLGYSVNGYSQAINPLRHADWRVLDGHGATLVRQMRGWGIDTMLQRERAYKAARFLNSLLTCSEVMSQAYAMLPDLAQTFGALGISGDYIRASQETTRGAKPFDRARFYRLEPSWAMDWAQHRTTLLSMALASKHDPKVPDGTVAVWHHYQHSTDHVAVDSQKVD